MSKPTQLECHTFACIDAFNEIVMQNTDADAHACLQRVKAHLDARIEQTEPLDRTWSTDPDEDLL
jgi:hypothetical protein